MTGPRLCFGLALIGGVANIALSFVGDPSAVHAAVGWTFATVFYCIGWMPSDDDL